MPRQGPRESYVGDELEILKDDQISDRGLYAIEGVHFGILKKFKPRLSKETGAGSIHHHNAVTIIIRSKIARYAG